MSFADFEPFGITCETYDRSEQALAKVKPAFNTLEEIREKNQLRVIAAMQEARLSESMFGGSTGYGYDDPGRDQIEKAYAVVFGAEKALVRIQISSGTQALALCLFGLLRPGGELLSVTGPPYDSLRPVIGLAGDLSLSDPGPDLVQDSGQGLDPDRGPGQDLGSLRDFGVTYGQVDLTAAGAPDLDAIETALTPHTQVVLIQKSRGYGQRRALLTEDLAAICRVVRKAAGKAIILVDNCYGEFVEACEPCQAGADLCAGSLIKNPGGGLCPSGGYVAGKAALVERVASRLTAPGLGRHIGPTLGFSRLIAQGLYLAPQIVCESLKGAVFAATLFQAAGFPTDPQPFDRRGDLVQSVTLGDSKKLVSFCQAIQAASPVDSHIRPEPWAMPGYADAIIMAAGTFVQGSSIELAADGPMRPPFIAYLQAGLSFVNARLACMKALQALEA